MKTFIIPFIVLLTLFPGLASCSTDEVELPPQTEQPTKPDSPSSPDEPGKDNEENNDEHKNPMSNKLTARIGNSTFTITLEDNATAKSFKALLPLTLHMQDLNGNEKYFNLSTNLPTAASRPSTIHTGDLMLFGSNCLVLFYETFSSSYSYTRLGKIDNPSGLVEALGSDHITVIVETWHK